MKITRILTVVVALCMSLGAMASRTDAGTYSLGVAFDYDTDSVMGSQIATDISIGKFTDTGKLWGCAVGFSDDDFFTTIYGGAIFEYDFLDTGSPMVPYVGLSLKIIHLSTELGEGDATALAAGAKLGMRFFFTESAALDLSINAEVATDDVYDTKDKMDSSDINAKLGMRFYF